MTAVNEMACKKSSRSAKLKVWFLEETQKVGQVMSENAKLLKSEGSLIKNAKIGQLGWLSG